MGRRMHPPKPVHTAAVTSIQTSFLSSQQGSQLATASQLPQPLSYLSPAPCGSQSHSHPHSPTEPLLSLLLQAMAAIRFFSWILRSLIQQARMVGEELDEATHECMQQRAEQLSQEMTWLLQEIEQKSQEQSGFAWGALLFTALQQCQFWVITGVPLLLCGFCWWLRRRSNELNRRGKEGSSRDEADEHHEVKPSVALNVGRISAKSHLDLLESFMMLQELVDGLVLICQDLSSNSFMPRLKPAIAVGSALEGWNPPENEPVFCLLMPLHPPQGHIFHLELGTTEERPAKNSSLRVELQCTCQRDDMLCFLHCPDEELRRCQSSSLLGTLCTGPYLDLEKTTCWFQTLVKAAWVVLPQSRHCRLTVLPSRRSCKLRLTNASDTTTIMLEMIFGVQQGDSDTFLSIE